MLNANRIKESQNAKGDFLITTTIDKQEKGFIVPQFFNTSELISKRDIENEMREHERSPTSVRKNTKPRWFYNTPFGVPRGINPHNLRTLSSSWIVQSCISIYQSDLRAMNFTFTAKNPKNAKDIKVIEAIDEATSKAKTINNDGESIQDLWEKWIKDILEIDAGVFVAHFSNNAYSQILDDNGEILEEYISDDYLWGKAVEFTTEDSALFYKDFYDDGQLMGYWHHTYNRGRPHFFSKRQINYSMFNASTYSPYGWSKVQQLYDVLIAMISSIMNTSDYMARGAIPAGIIELRGADEDEAKAFTDYWRKRVQGNPHKFAIIGSPENGQLNFIPLNFSIEDITFLNGLDFFRRVVLATFHISPNEMGLTDSINKANSESQERVVRRNQKMPMFTKIKRIMDTFFLPNITKNFELIEFTWETPDDVDKKIKIENITNTKLQNGRRTLNEIRIEDGEEPYDDERADIPMPFWKTQSQDNDLLGINVNSELEDIVNIISNNKNLILENFKKKDITDFDITQSENIDNFVKKETIALHIALIEAMKTWFNKVKEMVINFISRNPDKDVNTALLNTVNRISEPGNDVRIEIQSQIYKNISLIFEKAFNVQDDLTTEHPIFLVPPVKALEFLKTHALLVSDKLTSDLSHSVKQQIIMGMSNGEGIPDLSKRIQSVLDSSKTRAKTIARTETIRAMAEGQYQRMKQDGFKEWQFFAHIDDRTCEICMGLHEKKFKIENKKNLPPRHPNCRCTLLTVIPDEE